MSDTTPLLALPYPEGTDDVRDYPALGQLLAERLEDVIGWTEISDVTLGADAATLDISVPATFDHLALFYSARSALAAIFDSLLWRLNNVSTASTYAYGSIVATNGGAASHSTPAVTDKGEIGRIAGNSQAGFTDGTVRLINYRAARYRRWEFGSAGWTDANGGDQQVIAFGGGIHKSAGSNVADWLTSLRIYAAGGNLRAGSRFSLYGIRGPQ